MIKYIQDNFSLTSLQRQMLYKNGQTIFDKMKAEGGFIKVFCRNKLPSYLTEDDWINLYQSKIISFEYQKIVDGSCIQKPYFFNETELLENWNSETLDYIKQQTNVINLPKTSIEMIQLMFGLNILKKQYGYNNIIDDQKSQKQLTLNEFLENSTNHDYQQTAKVSISRKSKEFKYLKHFLPLSLKLSNINDALSYLRVDINGINKPQIEFNQNEHWIKQSLQFACFYLININVGQNICQWITINDDQFDNLKIIVQELFHINVMTDKSAWLKSEEFLLENNIKFTYIEQNPADIIILKPGTYAFAKPTNGLSINLSWHQASYNKEQFTYLLNQFIKFDSLNKNIPIKNYLLDIMIHEKKLEKEILDEIKKYLSICILEENQLIKSFNLMQAPKYLEKKEELFCYDCEKEIIIYFYFDKEIFCLKCGKQKQNYNFQNIKIRYRFHCLNYLINSEEQICNSEFCSNYLGKTKCSLQNQEKLEDEMKQKNSKNSKNYFSSQFKEQYSDDISSMSDYQQYKYKNQKLNQFNHFTALKKLKIE